MIASDTPVEVRPSVVFRNLAADDGGVLLHLESGQYHGVNPMGASIWRLIDGRTTASAISSELRTVLVDPPPDLEDVVVRFLNRLRDRDLLVARSADELD